MVDKDFEPIVRKSFKDIKEIVEKLDDNTINTEDEFNNLFTYIKLSSDSIIFRGQRCSKWKLKSTLFRFYKEIIKGNLTINNFLNIAKDHFNEINNKTNANNSLLHTLSEAQHLGTPTPLIDFTSSFENALWFALQTRLHKCAEHPNNSYESIDCKPSLFLILKTNNVRNKIDDSAFITTKLSSDLNDFIIYKCPISINSKRGVSQRSFFIMHNQEDMIKEYNIIQININNNIELQEYIIKFLTKSSINYESIFPDLKGVFNSYINESCHIYFLEGNYYAGDNQHNKAIEKYKKAIELNPNYYQAYYNWGNSLFYFKEYSEAIKKFKKSIELSPNDAWAYNIWGKSLFHLGEYSKAIEKYKKAIELNPNDAWAYNNWGMSLFQLGEYSKAIEKYKKAIELNPNYAWAYNNWGMSLFHLKEYSEAIKKFKKAIQLNPNHAIAYNNWGNSLFHLEEYSEVIKKYKKAIELNPNYIVAYTNLEVCLKNSFNQSQYKQNPQLFIEVLNNIKKLISNSKLINEDAITAKKQLLNRIEKFLIDLNKLSVDM